MMRYLLDTHTFIWYLDEDPRLPESAGKIIAGLDNQVFLSVASLWESMIKYRQKKLFLPQPPEIYIPIQRVRHQIENLDIDEASVCRLNSLPMMHKDPFDRILICQALQHQLTIITADQLFRNYAVPIMFLG